MSEVQNYYRNCIFYFRIDGMCARNLECGVNIKPCRYRFNCPWFEADPSLTDKDEDNLEE